MSETRYLKRLVLLSMAYLFNRRTSVVLQTSPVQPSVSVKKRLVEGLLNRCGAQREAYCRCFLPTPSHEREREMHLEQTRSFLEIGPRPVYDHTQGLGVGLAYLQDRQVSSLMQTSDLQWGFEPERACLLAGPNSSHASFNCTRTAGPSVGGSMARYSRPFGTPEVLLVGSCCNGSHQVSSPNSGAV